MLVKTYSAAVLGIDAAIVTCEVNSSNGIRIIIVGLPDASIKESRDRIQAAIEQCGLKFPRKQIVINMSPADLHKEGAGYDLPLAVGILAASEIIPQQMAGDYVMAGELSLDGSIRPVKGALSIALEARNKGFKGVIVANENAREAAIVTDIQVFKASHLKQVIDFFNSKAQLEQQPSSSHLTENIHTDSYDIDFEDVKGQYAVVRALEVAAAGSHNILLVGPPGAGKSMMAQRLPTILPPLTIEEALETTRIHSVAGLTADTGLIMQRPFRAPHHSISSVALIGGGSNPSPGEISMAHNGVLFLDEFPEFSRQALEVMRQPLEDRKICISRSRSTVTFPSSIMLVASMNPCPCGYYNHPTRDCVCAPGALKRYMNRISGPLLDRIDLQIEIVPVAFDDISKTEKGESSSEIRKRVIRAREIQSIRFKDCPGIYCNSQMNSRLINRFALPDKAGMERLKLAMNSFSLSARAYTRILKVARTIADLDQSDCVLSRHISEAIHYRNLDKNTWGM